MRRQTVIDTGSFYLTTLRAYDKPMPWVADALGWTLARTKHIARGAKGAYFAPYRQALDAQRIPEWGSPRGDLRWYGSVMTFMMMGTPPWTPSDYVDVRQDGALYVPTSSIVECGPHAYATPEEAR